MGYLKRGKDHPDVLALARSHHALPIWRDFGGAIFLRPDGVFLGSDWEAPGTIEVLTDNRPTRDMVHAARGYASKAFPDIEGLLPERGPTAVPCRTCDGTGNILGVSERHDNIKCSCGGLGWLPEEPVRPRP